jgi:superfamily II DNA or RNA helicase
MYYDKQGRTISSLFITDKFIEIPRNLKKFEKNYNKKPTYKFEFVEKNLQSPYKLKPDYTLRPQQQEILDKIKQYHNEDKNDIIIEMQTGGGKTAMLPYVVKELNQRTLILVDMTMLRDQMKEAFDEFTEQADVQIITSKTNKVADVNIVTTQLLHRNPHLIDLLKNEIGLVILDEAHIVAAETIKSTIQKFPAKYRIGLSATPSRSDGLDPILHDVFPFKIKTTSEAVVPITLLAVLC